jgi:hypothetical protein
MMMMMMVMLMIEYKENWKRMMRKGYRAIEINIGN